MPSFIIDNLIAKINATMTNFSQKSSLKQYNEHVQGVAKLQEDLSADSLQEGHQYFIGRYDISADQDLQTEIEQIKAREEVQKVQIEDAIARRIREKLSFPKGADVSIKASSVPKYVQVSLPTESIKIYMEQSKKLSTITQEVKPDDTLTSNSKSIKEQLQELTQPLPKDPDSSFNP